MGLGWRGNVTGKEIEVGCLDNSLNQVGFERREIPGGGDGKLRWYAEGGYLKMNKQMNEWVDVQLNVRC